MRLVVGIDEVGRGPLAGPVSVGIVVCRRHFSIRGITDSKLLSETERASMYAEALALQQAGELTFGVFSASAKEIDRVGIEQAITGAIERGLLGLVPDAKNVDVVLDGRLKAPRRYSQQSIIRGDALVPAISLAAIVAKVERDEHMREKVDRAYPTYGFASHKGYGTREHVRALRAFGPTPIHRMSFLSNILSDTMPV